MQVNLTFRAPEIEGATPTIMVEMVLGGKTPSPIIRQVLEAAVGQCCTVNADYSIAGHVVYRSAIRTMTPGPSASTCSSSVLGITALM